MKALKYVAGILLATIGLLLLIGGIALTFESEDTPLSMVLVVIVIGLLILGAALALLKGRSTKTPAPQCPKCGASETAPAGVMYGSRWGIVRLYFEVMLFPVSFFWEAGRKQQVRCLQCDALYSVETRRTYVAAIVFWIIALILVLGIIGQSMEQK